MKGWTKSVLFFAVSLVALALLHGIGSAVKGKKDRARG